MGDPDKDLRALALKATDGPWDHWNDREGVYGVVAEDTVCQMAYLREEDHTYIPYDDAPANAAFIAAANPQTVIGLLDRIDELKAALKPFAEHYDEKEGDKLAEAFIRVKGSDLRRAAKAGGTDA